MSDLKPAFIARPLIRMYRHSDGSFSDVSPGRAGKVWPRCTMSAPAAAMLVSEGFLVVNKMDEHGATELVQRGEPTSG